MHSHRKLLHITDKYCLPFKSFKGFWKIKLCKDSGILLSRVLLQDKDRMIVVRMIKAEPMQLSWKGASLYIHVHSTNLASVWSLDGSYSTSVVILSVRGLMTTVAPTGFLYGAAMSLQSSLNTRTRNNKPFKERILKQIWTIYLLRPTKKVFGFWSYTVGRLQNWCGDALYFLGNLFFLPTSEIRDTCICSYWNQTKFPHTKYGG